MRASRDRFAGANWLPDWATGRYYGSPLITGMTASSIGSTLLRAMPFYIPNNAGVTITQIGLEITTAGTAGHVMRFSIYEDLNGHPGGLFRDLGTVPVDPGAVPTFQNTQDHGTPFTQLLRQGWWWFGFSAQSGNCRNFNAGSSLIVHTLTRDTEGTTGVYATGYGYTPNSSVVMTAYTVQGHPDLFPYEQSDLISGMPRILVKT